MTRVNQSLITELLEQIEALGKDRSLLPFAETSIDELISQIEFLHQPGWSLPALTIPVWEYLRNEALWITSYLDEKMRIGRGVTGNLFVFER